MDFTQFAKALQSNIAQVIVGKADATELLLVTLLVEGHVLIEDVPGIGKTTARQGAGAQLGWLVRAHPVHARPAALGCDGLSIFNQRTQAFEFRPGPIFSQILLADEINRATPRTQSALLEAMQERQCHRRRADLSAAAAVSGAGNAEPDRTGRHFSPPGGAA